MHVIFLSWITYLTYVHACDRCIFVWRLSPDLTHNIHQRLITLGKMSKEQLINEENRCMQLLCDEERV